MKPNCYQCEYRRSLSWDSHSRCVHPAIEMDTTDIIKAFMPFMDPGAVLKWLKARKALSIVGNDHGIQNGWFNWPFNFDPIWLIHCEGFIKKDSNKNEL